MSEHDMRRLMELIERTLGREWLDLDDWIRDQNSLDDIEARIRDGDWRGAVGKIEDAALKFAAEIHTSYVQSGQAAAAWLDKQPQTADRLVRFDQANERSVDRARRNQLELVRGFQDERAQVTRQVVRRAMVEGAQGGINPRQVARDFRASIGLTPYQEEIVANYRRELERGDWANALGRELTNGHNDRTVRRLQRDGGRLTERQVDAMVEGYRKNWIGYRAETIARTEALRNAHEGAAEATQQAIDGGVIEAEDIMLEWHAGPRTLNAREQHRAMDGKTTRHGEPFVLPDGTRMSHPGDPAGGAKHNANCRCAYSTTLR
jgi:hypothetical protein